MLVHGAASSSMRDSLLCPSIVRRIGTYTCCTFRSLGRSCRPSCQMHRTQDHTSSSTPRNLLLWKGEIELHGALYDFQTILGSHHSRCTSSFCLLSLAKSDHVRPYVLWLTYFPEFLSVTSTCTSLSCQNWSLFRQLSLCRKSSGHTFSSNLCLQEQNTPL
jgi:hypothetical protein